MKQLEFLLFMPVRDWEQKREGDRYSAILLQGLVLPKNWIIVKAAIEKILQMLCSCKK